MFIRNVTAEAGLICLLSFACTLPSERKPAISAVPLDSAGTVQNQPMQLPLKSPSIVVYKARRQLELFDDERLLRSYSVGLGFNPVEDKRIEGDGRTPEGEFYIFTKNPKSAYYLSLGLSYPNIEDARRGFRARLITKAQHDEIVRAIQRKQTPPQYTRLGGLIYIHGNGAQSDWTLGCVALENGDIRELYDAVDVGTPVIIKP